MAERILGVVLRGDTGFKDYMIPYLTPPSFIEKMVQLKSEKRLQNSVQIMKPYGDRYSCKTCFHHKSKSCTDILPQGCEDWTDGEDSFKSTEKPFQKQGIIDFAEKQSRIASQRNKQNWNKKYYR